MKKVIQKKKELSSNQVIEGVRKTINSKPYFVIGVIASIIIICLFIFAYTYEDYSQEKASYAKQIYLELNTTIDEYILGIDEQIAAPQETTLDDDYLYSIKSDLEWLKSKNESVFHSKPSAEVFAKEAALSLSAKTIIELNINFAFEITGTNQQEKIDSALLMDVNTPILLTDDELVDVFESDSDRKIFLETTKQIFDDYVAAKKILIKNSTSKERQYVEAKKIILLAYSNASIDENYSN